MPALDATTSVLLVLATGLVGLALIPLGLPGLWVIVLGILGFGWLTDFRTLGVGSIVAVLGLAVLGEVVEAYVGFRFAQRYGGSRRAGWGALIGGLIGAIVGVPVPVIGSVIGAFAGAFVGAAVLEYSKARHSEGAVRAGWGAVLGRALAAGFKIGVGVVLVVIGLFAALRS
ncbi:MAG TPA: DUF456 domain-containing protein [Gemmatimonadales bacterium]|jgi:uncharacterized protein YqgC (DUF456 family)